MAEEGNFALAMLVSHRQALRAAVLHEPALFMLFDDPEEARNRVTEVVTAGMEAGGPRVALESFIRLVAGDANWEPLDPTVRERILASASTYFGNEIGKFDTDLPDDETLASIAVPVHLLVGEDSLPHFAQAVGRLAARLQVDITRVPGTHLGYLDHPATGADRSRTASERRPLTIPTARARCYGPELTRRSYAERHRPPRLRLRPANALTGLGHQVITCQAQGQM